MMNKKLLYRIEDKKTILLGLLTILILLWSILYLIPELMITLLNTLLGNLILIIIVYLVGLNNLNYGIILGIILITILIVSYRLVNSKEGFKWSVESTQKLLEVQKTINPNLVLDPKVIQTQVSQEELDYFLKNGNWYWDEKVKKLYLNAINQNVFIRSYPPDSLNQARKIYNQVAILEILAGQSKEGIFLQRGVVIHNTSNKCDIISESDTKSSGTYGYTSGLISNTERDNPIITCKSDNSGLEKNEFVSHQFNNIKTFIKNEDVEKEIPGFKFINGECNPCSNKCPFILDISGNNNIEISDVYKYIWKIFN